MEQVTIEGILDRSLLQLVKHTPTNPMTRGQVRAATNLVIPDEVVTSEGIIEYVLENYDKNKAPKEGWQHLANGDQRAFQAMERRVEQEQRELEQQQREREALFTAETRSTEYRLYDTVERHKAYYSGTIHFSSQDFDGCVNKQDVINEMRVKAREMHEEQGYDDEDHIDVLDSELSEIEEYNHETDWESIWEQHKHAISEALGLSLTEME
tara:strand:+ start:2028 stop:2660 length:633 start_codon:yes stop_codon:yes gene_type:complete